MRARSRAARRPKTARPRTLGWASSAAEVDGVPFLAIVIHSQTCFPRSMAASGTMVAVRNDEVSSCREIQPITRRRTFRNVSLIGALLLTATVYSLPWISASHSARAGLPPIFGADFYAYLNLSHVFTVSGFPDQDPWYGVPIQPKFGHSTFRAAFVLFGAARSVLGSDVATSIVWSVCWSVLIGCSVWLLLRAIFEEGSSLFLFAGMSMIIFFSLSTLKINMVDWLHLPSGGIPGDLPLPFIRMFFPQIAIPLLAFYFFFCKKAWDRGYPRDFVPLVLIQIAAFLSFPYGSVFMGLATFIFLALIAKRLDLRTRVLQFGAMGVFSLLADALYVWLVVPHSRAATQAAPTAVPLFHFDLTQLQTDFGGTVVLLLLFAIPLLVMRQKGSFHLLIAAIGLANVCLLLADCLIDPRLLVSHHAGYFVQLSLGLELCALAYWAENLFSRRLFAVGAAATSIFFVLNGVLASWAAVRRSAETNASLGQFASVMSGLNLSSEDLVIAPAKEVDDVSTTVPLLSRAHVLYTPEAEILLGPGDESLMRERQAAYLFLSGQDSSWLETQLSKHLLPSAILTIGQRFALQYRRRPDLLEQEVRQNLLPRMVALDRGVIPPVFALSHRVIVLDDVGHPIFDDSHVSRVLRVNEDYKSGAIRVRVCSTAPAKN